jgi:hypothetical protein
MRPASLLVIALAACKSTQRAPAPNDDAAVRTAVEQVLADQYKAVERGDLDAWGAPFDTNVFLFGSDPTEATAGKDELLAQMKKNAADRMRSDITRTYRSTRLAVGVAPDRRAAWAADEIDYTLRSSKGEKNVHFRMTSLLALEDRGWRILASHYSVEVHHEDAFRKAGAHELPMPKQLGTQVAPGAEPLVDRFRQGVANPGASAAWISDRPGVIFYGTAPGERHDGTEVKRLLAGAKMAARLTIPDGVRAGIVGNAGWVAGNIVVSLGELEVPFRTLEFYVKEGNDWKLVCAHSSIGVPD